MSQARPRHLRWLKRSLVVFIAVGVLGILALFASAAHLPFTDVPTSGLVHDAVGWIYTRSITVGCTATLYCPNDPVTRASMAVFMNRLGVALTPRRVERSQFASGALDIDPSPRVCATTTDYTPAFPQRAYVQGWVSLRATGAYAAYIDLDYSIDGGVTWISLPTGIVWSTLGSSTAGEWAQAFEHSYLDLTAGTNYRFAFRIFRRSGTADPDGFECRLVATMFNRNPDGVAPGTGTDLQMDPANPAENITKPK